MLPPTPADFIGAGPFWSGEAQPDAPAAFPGLFPRGAPMGQHLAVERLVRVAEDRLIYLVNNLSRKWSRRMCWACGNKFSPDSAKNCTYCGQPLSDQRFLMTARWNRSNFDGFEALTRHRVRHFGIVSPVYAFYRNNMLMAVYHYDGGAMLQDFAAPLPTARVLRMTIHLADALAHLHERGVVLRDLAPHNVLLMPDGSPRLFDVDTEAILSSPQDLYRDPRQPALRDTRALARMMLAYCSPEDAPLNTLLGKAADGLFPGPIPLQQLAKRLLRERAQEPPPSPPVAAYSDLGLYRAANEDAWKWKRLSEHVSLYAVADGMGGLTRGREAADLTLHTLAQALEDTLSEGKPDAKRAKDMLIAGVRRANDTVYRARKARNLEMGATLTALLVVEPREVYVVHVGDSSAWRLHGGKLTRLTAEHTVAAELLADKTITPEQFATHRARHVLTSAMGMEPTLDQIDFQQLSGARGDRLLLCSDGLTGEVSEDAIRGHLESWADRHKAVRELVRAAYANGGHDNLTVLIVDLG